MPILLESIARTKWCPFARLVAEDNPQGDMRLGTPAGFNRGTMTPGQEISARCIASACMAWRSQEITLLQQESPGPEYRDGGEKWQFKFKPSGLVEETLTHVWSAPAGYCGLAGKPEAP